MKEGTVLRLSRIFLPLGAFLKKMLPNLDSSLLQLDINISPEEYIAGAFFFFFVYVPNFLHSNYCAWGN